MLQHQLGCGPPRSFWNKQHKPMRSKTSTARVETLERAAASASKTPKRSANLTWVSARPLPGAGTRPAHIDAPRLESAKTGEEVIE